MALSCLIQLTRTNISCGDVISEAVMKILSCLTRIKINTGGGLKNAYNSVVVLYSRGKSAEYR